MLIQAKYVGTINIYSHYEKLLSIWDSFAAAAQASSVTATMRSCCLYGTVLQLLRRAVWLVGLLMCIGTDYIDLF